MKNIKPIIYHPKKGRKIIKSLNLKKINFNEQTVNVTYEELPKFLKEESKYKIADKKILIRLNSTYEYSNPKKGRKMIKSIICNSISDDNKINNENINIGFQEFNDNNYQIEIFENDEKIQKLKELKKEYKQILESLMKIKNQIEELNSTNSPQSENTNISNILEWSTNIATITAGVTAPVPIIGTAASSIATITAGACAVANSIIKNQKNYKKIEDLEIQNDDNNIFIQIEDEINSMDLTNQPSTSSYRPVSM